MVAFTSSIDLTFGNLSKKVFKKNRVSFIEIFLPQVQNVLAFTSSIDLTLGNGDKLSEELLE